ncbi:Aminoglycoside phosphotransferase [Penicillium coprophilum]|uniref:Aminoglycoside phosphotransferase n=1 Tax=Penicillium coprophilum TaxID=36646 RepID=UPI00238B6BB1|nr:Aminoglycoside phosphotransferase [Penicillium coprophilum]KAJ5158373.1 Aminoglycoside phosphotransferase [Penicillium coprophilum]
MAPLVRYQTTTQLIESARLTPTEHSIWRAFLDEAVDPEYAACYIWERIHDRAACSIEQTLDELKIDWKRLVTKLAKRDLVSSQACTLVETRDNSHCFMLDQKPSDPNVSVRFDHAWVIPPSLFNDSDMDPRGSLYPLLRAFLTPTKASELQAILQTDTPEYKLKNLFLLSPSVHSAFRNGRIRIFPATNTPDQWNDETEARIKTAGEVCYFVHRLSPEPCGGLFLSDGSHWNSTMQMFIMESQDTNQHLPDPFLLRTHYRIAASMHLFYVEERIAEGWPSPPLFRFNQVTQKILRSVWRLVPHFLRVQCYGVLLNLGSHLYPRSFTGLVHQLPFGLYAKECTRTPNEGETLRLMERYTSIPAPLWVDDYQGLHRVLIMTSVPGQTLDVVFHRLSYSERKQLSKDLKNVLSQLRSIPNQTPYRFGDSHGGPLFDYRFPSGVCGPFHQISDFNSFLVHKYVLSETREKVAAVHARSYRSVFTHADLHPKNIIINRGRLSGIVDWECAGFYPEYWEFTKLFYGLQPSPEIQAVIHDAFTGDTYEEELAAERLLWYATPFGV